MMAATNAAARSRRPWTPEEDATLKALWEEKQSVKAILRDDTQAIFGRTNNDVEERLKEMGWCVRRIPIDDPVPQGRFLAPGDTPDLCHGSVPFRNQDSDYQCLICGTIQVVAPQPIPRRVRVRR
jgi:hypothetical protein